MNLRDDWRILLLVLLIAISAVTLFVPSAGGAASGAGNTSASNASVGNADTSQGVTNLRFGLQLSGGTRIRAPLVGLTAQGVPVDANDTTQVATAVTERLGVSPTDVQVRQRSANTADIEVFSKNVTQPQFASALQASGVDATVRDVRPGVTRETVNTEVDVLKSKVSQAGLSGATVQTVQSGGRTFVVVEVPNANRGEVLRLIGDRGQVEVVAHFPAQGNGSQTYRNETVLTGEDIAQIGAAQPAQGGQPPNVPISLTEQAARPFAKDMRQYGFTGPGISACTYQQSPQNAGYCLYSVVDGRVVYAAGMSPDLARDFETGDFVRNPSFVIQTSNLTQANQLQINLQAGALPTALDIQGGGTTQYIQPSLGARFKLYALVTGIIAVFAVSLVVFIRYREARIAAPMIVTAFAEVFLLLGFAAAIGYPLDLAAIAGFIAVIGTGVDDLIIIADEIIQQGETRTRRMFRRRFRKAFWPIAAAAATLIVAMAPLSVLSLGDLQGFAIITIVGVLIGVLVTRPAYGDILRRLMTR